MRLHRFLPGCRCHGVRLQHAAHRHLNVGIHILHHAGSRREDSLIGKHEAHVAEDADVSLLHAVDAVVEVGRDDNKAMHHLLLHQVARLQYIVAAIGHLDIWRCVILPCKLSACCRMTHVDDRNRHLFHYLVVVSPGIEQRIEDRHDDEEDGHTFVVYKRFHLLCPYIAYIVEALQHLLFTIYN